MGKPRRDALQTKLDDDPAIRLAIKDRWLRAASNAKVPVAILLLQAQQLEDYEP